MGIVVFRHLNPARVFFLLWPHFARAPRHWFLENFLLSAPGVQSFFFFVALRWAPATFRRGQSKKKTSPRVFFFAPAPGKGRGRRSPVPARGQSKKKTPPRVFFLLRPRRKAREGEAPLGAGTGPEQKKNTTQGVFFSGPRGKAGEGEAPLGAGTAPKPQTLNQLIVEARKLEHNCPHTLKVEYRGSQH